MAKFLNKNNSSSSQKSKSPSIPGPISKAYSGVKKRFSFLKWADPFTYVDLFVMPHVKRITDNGLVELAVNIFFALLFAYVLYTLLGILFGSASPLVIVYSASMEPAFVRGDVMALTKAFVSDSYGESVVLDRSIAGAATLDYVSPVFAGGELSSLIFKRADSSTFTVPLNKNGNVVVYSAFPSGMPIIHRAIVKIHALDGDFVLTKGDNTLTNPTFDADCGRISAFAVSEKPCITFYATPISELHGKTFFMIPKIGCVKLWLLDDLSSLFFSGKLPADFKGIC